MNTNGSCHHATMTSTGGQSPQADMDEYRNIINDLARCKAMEEQTIYKVWLICCSATMDQSLLVQIALKLLDLCMSGKMYDFFDTIRHL